MVFRDGIKPEWKDEMNIDGGRWLMEIDRQYRNEQLNSKWLETLLAIIGKYLPFLSTIGTKGFSIERINNDRASFISIFNKNNASQVRL